MDALARVVQQATTGAAVRKRLCLRPVRQPEVEEVGDRGRTRRRAHGGDRRKRPVPADRGAGRRATTRTSYSGGNMVFYAAPGGDTLDGYALSGPSTEVSGRSVALFRSETQLVVAAAGTNQCATGPTRAPGGELGSSQYTAAMRYAEVLIDSNPGMSCTSSTRWAGVWRRRWRPRRASTGTTPCSTAAGLHPRTVGREAFDRLHGTHFHSSRDVCSA